MKSSTRAPNAFRHRALWATGSALAAGIVLTVGAAAQPDGVTPDDSMNGIIERFERGEPSFNGEAFQLMPDLEHNPFRLDDLERGLAALRPAGSTRPTLAPIVRIPYEADQDYKHLVKQLLDVGLMGIILPGVRTPEEALRFVGTMRYPPQRTSKYPEPAGLRGWSPGGALRLWGLTETEYARKADLWPLNPEGELLAIAMIETPEAVTNIREILNVPGLGAVLIGQADLSMELGVGTPGANRYAPEVEAAVAEVAEACVALKKLCGSYQSPDIEARVAQGFRLFTVARGDYR